MPSLRARLVNRLLRTTTKGLWRPGLDIVEVRRHTAKMEARLVRRPPAVATEAVDAGGIPATWFGAAERARAGTLLYLHGGAWCLHLPRVYARFAALLSNLTGMRVLLPDYRLAPEHPFPTPFEDCLAAVRWAHREASRFGGDAARLAIGGDSAGGNLSAAVSAALAGDPARPKAALLIYGVFDFGMLDAGSVTPDGALAADARAVQIGKDMVEMMVGAYLGAPGARREELARDPRVSPLRVADRLPPSHVVVGSADPLAVQAEALVKALSGAGVAHEHFVDPGMPHGYAQMEFLPGARPAIERMVEFLRRHV
jgi:acetyl esterase/lipase